jgi:hypothetical protein
MLINGGIRPHSQCKRQHRHDRECGLLEQHAPAVSQILKQIFHMLHAALLAAFLLHLIDSAD